MSEVLSQNQIDDLLKSLKSGDISVTDLDDKDADKKVRPYDFKIPKKFNKEQLKTINIIYENYGRILASYLSGTLRNFCEVKVVTIEEQRYFEYSNALSENILMGVMEMPPLQGTSIITINQSIAFAIVDRLLGGQGDYYEADRDYTDIETAILERSVKDMSILLKDAWSNVFAIDPKFIRLEINSRQNQLVSPNETVVIVMLDVKIKDVEGNISFCMPYVMLEPVLEHLNTRYWFTERKITREEQEQNKQKLLESVRAVPVELWAVLGTSSLTIQDMMNLQIGDVIELGTRIKDPITVMCNKEKWFKGSLGRDGRRLAVKVDQVLLEDGVGSESKQ